MKVKNTLKGNVKITLTMAELKGLKQVLNRSHYIGHEDEESQKYVAEGEKTASRLCQVINNFGVFE